MFSCLDVLVVVVLVVLGCVQRANKRVFASTAWLCVLPLEACLQRIRFCLTTIGRVESTSVLW